MTRPLRAPSGLARLLYSTIGRECSWQSRLGWPESVWRSELDRPGTELWLSWWNGRVTGFAEIAGSGGDVRIRYLGLFPEFRGRGLGGRLLVDVGRRAWTLHHRWPQVAPIRRVVLDTTALDDRWALPNYLARGFSIVEQAVEERPVLVIPRPRGPATVPR